MKVHVSFTRKKSNNSGMAKLEFAQNKKARFLKITLMQKKGTLEARGEDIFGCQKIKIFRYHAVHNIYWYGEKKSIKVPTRHVNANKQPNLKQYDTKTDQINLTCTASGKPEPKYIWFKQDNKDNTLSERNTYVIEDVNSNNSGIYICEAFNIINNIIYRNSYSVAIDIVHTAYAISFSCAAVVAVLCFVVMKRHCKRDNRNIHSGVSEDQENISEENDYEEIESVSYQEVNPHNDMIETINQLITEEEIVLENIPNSTCTSSSENYVPLSHLYVNTNIIDTNESHKMSGNKETISNHQNGLENCNIRVEHIFVSENSESDTLVVHQYVNMTSLRVPNVYEDLNHATADIQNYESLDSESNKTYEK
ncbi:CD106 [Mytilus edulis]|uniref:VCAM1 n=1 Tax=Mytilus edulis TaxID=6550 RepID=A0A8S3UFE1_MYTED|nr:CD106 [Mytilus edulis]